MTKQFDVQRDRNVSSSKRGEEESQGILCEDEITLGDGLSYREITCKEVLHMGQPNLMLFKSPCLATSLGHLNMFTSNIGYFPLTVLVETLTSTATMENGVEIP